MFEIYGYVRVSAKNQNVTRQIMALENFGVLTKNIFIDRQSGKDFERPAYQRLITIIQPADVLVVKIYRSPRTQLQRYY